MKSFRIAINLPRDLSEDLLTIYFQLGSHSRYLLKMKEKKDKYMDLLEKKRNFFHSLTPDYPDYKEIEIDLSNAEYQIFKYDELEEQIKTATFMMHQIERIQEEFKKEFGSIR